MAFASRSVISYGYPAGSMSASTIATNATIQQLEAEWGKRFIGFR